MSIFVSCRVVSCWFVPNPPSVFLRIWDHVVPVSACHPSYFGDAALVFNTCFFAGRRSSICEVWPAPAEPVSGTPYSKGSRSGVLAKCFSWRPGVPRPNNHSFLENLWFWALVPQASKQPLGQNTTSGSLCMLPTQGGVSGGGPGLSRFGPVSAGSGADPGEGGALSLRTSDVFGRSPVRPGRGGREQGSNRPSQNKANKRLELMRKLASGQSGTREARGP